MVEQWCAPIRSVNYHIWRSCNMKCAYCFATYDSVLDSSFIAGLNATASKRLLWLLREGGFEKVTFAGGEPTLCPWLDEIVYYAHSLGFITCLVTNAYRLTAELVDRLAGALSWLTLSVDSADSQTNLAIGRSVAGRRVVTAEQMLAVARRLKSHGVRLKVNTVVSAYNCEELLAGLVVEIAPERWKIMRMLKVDGENDSAALSVAVSSEQFRNFVGANTAEPGSIAVVIEDNMDMTSSYVMVDPAGRFLDNSIGRYSVSSPILNVGVQVAYQEMNYDKVNFIHRGGLYDW